MEICTINFSLTLSLISPWSHARTLYIYYSVILTLPSIEHLVSFTFTSMLEISFLGTSTTHNGPVGCIPQYRALTHREILLTRRWFFSKPRLFQYSFIIVALSIVYWQQPRHESHLRDKLGQVSFWN